MLTLVVLNSSFVRGELYLNKLFFKLKPTYLLICLFHFATLMLGKKLTFTQIFSLYCTYLNMLIK